MGGESLAEQHVSSCAGFATAVAAGGASVPWRPEEEAPLHLGAAPDEAGHSDGGEVQDDAFPGGGA